MIPRRASPSLALTVLLSLAASGLLLGAATASAQEASTTPSDAPSAIPSPMKPPAGGFTQSGCENCHGDPAIEDKGDGLYVPESRISHTVHAGNDCTTCHLQTQGVLHGDPEAEIAYAKASCKDCHADVVAAYEASAHGTTEGGPGCTDCHTTHDIQPADNRAFVIAAANDLCANCHDDQGSSFFRDNYHGKEANLGRQDIAVCADCHTAHSVLPPGNPDSSIAPDNRVTTCGACHDGANRNFSNIQIHVDADPIPSDPKLAVATLYFIVILTMTFGLFGWHMILGIRHEFRTARERANGTNTDAHDEEQP